jgi:hypothetical protein
MNYELSKILHAYCNFFANPEATSQSIYNVLAILYLLLHYRKNMHLIDDITIVLAKDDNEL